MLNDTNCAASFKLSFCTSSTTKITDSLFGGYFCKIGPIAAGVDYASCFGITFKVSGDEQIFSRKTRDLDLLEFLLEVYILFKLNRHIYMPIRVYFSDLSSLDHKHDKVLNVTNKTLFLKTFCYMWPLYDLDKTLL